MDHFIDKEDSLVVYDLRGINKEHFFILKSKERFLYLLCDKIQPFSKKILADGPVSTIIIWCQ